jgi:uncharacterized protein (DUF2235 family)
LTSSKGTTGKGLAENVLEAYLFIAENYNPKDQLFLFGFSRGAYTVRSVAAFIGWLGILTKQGLRHLKPLYELYQQATDVPTFTSLVDNYVVENRLKSAKWRLPPHLNDIMVLGCWETVGSVGLPEGRIVRALHLNDKWGFLDIGLAPRVRYSFHALALDEHRSTFYPTIWWKHPDAHYERGKKIIYPELQQCWFPGHHGDVGGGSDDRKISNLSLAWMIDQCSSRDLLDFDYE